MTLLSLIILITQLHRRVNDVMLSKHAVTMSCALYNKFLYCWLTLLNSAFMNLLDKL